MYPGTNTVILSKTAVDELIRKYVVFSMLGDPPGCRIKSVESVNSYGTHTGEFKIEFTTDPAPAPVPSTLPVVESAS